MISYGDIVFKHFVLHALLNDPSEISVTVDSDFRKQGAALDYVSATNNHEGGFFTELIQLKSISSVNPSAHNKFKNVDGEFIGLWKISESRVETVLRLMNLWNEEGVLKQRSIPELLNHLAMDEKINVKYIRGSWMDVDTIVDLQKAGML